MSTQSKPKPFCRTVFFKPGHGIKCEIKNTMYSYKHVSRQFWEQRSGKWVQLSEAELVERPYIRNCLTGFYYNEQKRYAKATNIYPSKRQRFATRMQHLRAASPG